MTEHDPALESIGRELLDVDGAPIGTIEDVIPPDNDFVPPWLVVRIDHADSTSVLVPEDTVRSVGGRLFTPYNRSYIQGAPRIGDGAPLSATDERRLYFHYGLDYAASRGDGPQGCGLCRKRRSGECSRG